MWQLASMSGLRDRKQIEYWLGWWSPLSPGTCTRDPEPSVWWHIMRRKAWRFTWRVSLLAALYQIKNKIPGQYIARCIRCNRNSGCHHPAIFGWAVKTKEKRERRFFWLNILHFLWFWGNLHQYQRSQSLTPGNRLLRQLSGLMLD